MSYAIYYDFSEKFCGEDYENLTLEILIDDEEKLIETEEFKYFYENYKNDKDEDETEEEHMLSLVEKFIMCSREYDELRDRLTPIYNYVHILQEKPIDEQVELVSKYVGNCVLIYIEELDVYGIALKSAGMDYSDSIELAYYLTDGVSPIKADQILSLRGENAELLEYCRKVAEEKGRVFIGDIEKFLEKINAA